MPTMVSDRQGLALTGTTESIEAYDRALDRLVRFQAEVVDETRASMDADPGFVMGRLLSVYLSLMSTDGGDVARARSTLDEAKQASGSRSLQPRERAHLAAAETWVAGDLLGAGRLLDDITVEHPQDLLALAVGHQIDFLSGNALNLRDRIGRALAVWAPDDPRFGFVSGMHAFGLEECNLYDQAREAGYAALDAHAEDVWAIHAVVHTYEMQGRVRDGVRFMRQREADWVTGNFLNVHNSWHYALYLLDAGDAPAALDLYDRAVRHAGSSDVAFELLDASGLLWRLWLDAVDVGGRFRPLADAWAAVLRPGFYPFNDMHAVIAFVGAGDLERARDLVVALEQVVESGDRSTSGWAMTARVGLDVCRGVLHHGEGAYAAAIGDLWGVRARLHEFGGSHAQRDVVERTLIEAAIRSGRFDLASALVSERLAVRERSAYSWTIRRRVLAGTGRSAAAEAAGRRAAEIEAEGREALVNP